MPAFRHSASLRTDLLELDVQMTLDNQIVVFHDDRLGRMCGPEFKDRKISEYTFIDLPRLKVPLHLSTQDTVVSNQDSYRIPLLSQIFTEFPGYPIQIDVKSGSEDMIRQVGNMIIDDKRQNITIWGSFRQSQHTYCVQHFGVTIPIFFSASRLFMYRFLYSLGLQNQMNIYESAAIMPNFTFLMNKGFIENLNTRGVSVIVFGGDGSGSIDSESKWKICQESGANGICSNSPTQLKEWLAVNKLNMIL